MHVPPHQYIMIFKENMSKIIPVIRWTNKYFLRFLSLLLENLE